MTKWNMTYEDINNKITMYNQNYMKNLICIYTMSY